MSLVHKVRRATQVLLVFLGLKDRKDFRARQVQRAQLEHLALLVRMDCQSLALMVKLDVTASSLAPQDEKVMLALLDRTLRDLQAQLDRMLLISAQCRDLSLVGRKVATPPLHLS